jgi:hypothetical protein
MLEVSQWLTEFTDAILGIKDIGDYTKATTSVLEQLYKVERDLSKIENELLLKQSKLVSENKSLSMEKIGLLGLEDPEYKATLEKKQELELILATLKRALELLRNFKDMYIAELRS